MFELKLGITLVVVGFIIMKFISKLYTRNEEILVHLQMVDDDDYPTYKSIVLVLSLVSQVVGLVYILIALWKFF